MTRSARERGHSPSRRSTEQERWWPFGPRDAARERACQTLVLSPFFRKFEGSRGYRPSLAVLGAALFEIKSTREMQKPSDAAAEPKRQQQQQQQRTAPGGGQEVFPPASGCDMTQR